MSDLVGNPEDRFSHVVAQMVVAVLLILGKLRLCEFIIDKT